MDPHDRTELRPAAPFAWQVAYFSMEFALAADIPTYAGGLGVLAGDTLRAAADLGVPMVAVSLAHRHGYFRQTVDALGVQHEAPARWSPEQRLAPLPHRVAIELRGRTVVLRAFAYGLRGVRGSEVTVLLLDADVEPNHSEDRALTNVLYPAEPGMRLAQEAILGIGGVLMLRAAGGRAIQTWHMNEGHSALLTLALAEEIAAAEPDRSAGEVAASVVRCCVFTTHTPVPAGHDRFPRAVVREVLGEVRTSWLERSGAFDGGALNMTLVALRGAHFVNGVAMQHRTVSSGMYPGYPIGSITNGVHAATWASPPFQALFDRHVPEWRRQNLNLRYAVAIPLDEIGVAHREAKEQLLAAVAARSGRQLDRGAFTVGFARRATAYKRADLVFRDLGRLRAIAHRAGPLQLLFSGKAHPADGEGKEVIRRIAHAAGSLGTAVPVVYLPDYDIELAKLLCAGADLWLNTPRRPLEASGTSGMKAALNGVPSLSVLDGWWREGHVEGVTGWAIGDDSAGDDPAAEAGSLYEKLEQRILPLFHGDRSGYLRVMRSAIAINGSFFNAERMVFQYAENAYGL